MKPSLKHCIFQILVVTDYHFLYWFHQLKDLLVHKRLRKSHWITVKYFFFSSMSPSTPTNQCALNEHGNFKDAKDIEWCHSPTADENLIHVGYEGKLNKS